MTPPVSYGKPIQGVGGTGGGGVSLGPEQNSFGDTSTASKSAAETLRDTYGTANASWLTEYNNDRSFLIRLIWSGNATEVSATGPPNR